MHPLTPDLSKISLEELQKKQSDLTNRLSTAYRWGNPAMVHQLQMLLQDYNAEVSMRGQKALAEMQKNSKQFKNIIDIQ